MLNIEKHIIILDFSDFPHSFIDSFHEKTLT